MTTLLKTIQEEERKRFDEELMKDGMWNPIDVYRDGGKLHSKKIKDFLDQAIQRTVEEIEEWGENKRKNITGSSVIEDGKPLDKGTDYYDGYNQLLSDLQEFLKTL